MCDIKEDVYIKGFESTCKERFSEGRSGAFMFFSSDQRCIVKTMSKGDMMALYRILPSYVTYLKSNPNSIIVRFLGAHSITMYGVTLYFVVMLNVFPTMPLSERYDLKGSWVNRHGFKSNQKLHGETLVRGEPNGGSTPLYQDNDLQHKIFLQPEVVHLFTQQIERDALFLRGEIYPLFYFSVFLPSLRLPFPPHLLSHQHHQLPHCLRLILVSKPELDSKLMDYSLLIGVKRERFAVLSQSNSSTLPSGQSIPPPLPTPDGTGNVEINPLRRSMSESAVKMSFSTGMEARIVEGPGMYYFGIIDILQEYNFAKRLERFSKVYFQFQDPLGISAMEPVAYAERFLHRCVRQTFEGLEDEEVIDETRRSYVIAESQLGPGQRESLAYLSNARRNEL